MPDYVFRSRDGQVKRIYSPKDLSKEEMEEVGYHLFEDISMTPSDLIRGRIAIVSDMAYSMGESLVDFLNDESEVESEITAAADVTYKVPAFMLNKHVVWGATAMMLIEIKSMINQILKK